MYFKLVKGFNMKELCVVTEHGDGKLKKSL